MDFRVHVLALSKGRLAFVVYALCDGSSHVVNVGGLYPVLLWALIDDQKRSVSGTLLRLSQIR